MLKFVSLAVPVSLIFFGGSSTALPPAELSSALIFHAPFDESTDARKGTDPLLYTSETLERRTALPGNLRKDVSIVKDAGRHRGALRFADNSPQVLFYKGVNAGFQEKNWSGTVSLWLKLNPDEDLKPGYCDPIQITDKTWNDAAFFVDFDKDLPRAFRLGVFPDYKLWNAKDTPWEQIAIADRPMVPVAKPPFTSSAWTHVCYTFENINSIDGSDGAATLYLNGKSQGSLKRPMKFSWDPEKSAIMLGIAYIGDFDDLSIFNRALTAEEIQQLFLLPHGAGEL